MRRKLRFFYDILLEFDAPITDHAFVLRCIPPSFPGQEILEANLTLEPDAAYLCQQDAFGNLIQVGRIDAPHDRFRYTVQGRRPAGLGRLRGGDGAPHLSLSLRLRLPQRGDARLSEWPRSAGAAGGSRMGAVSGGGRTHDQIGRAHV